LRYRTKPAVDAGIHRDESMISRLYGWYQGYWDKQKEEKLTVVLAR
jgi:hypothetical protein